MYGIFWYDSWDSVFHLHQTGVSWLTFLWKNGVASLLQNSRCWWTLCHGAYRPYWPHVVAQCPVKWLYIGVSISLSTTYIYIYIHHLTVMEQLTHVPHWHLQQKSWPMTNMRHVLFKLLLNSKHSPFPIVFLPIIRSCCTTPTISSLTTYLPTPPLNWTTTNLIAVWSSAWFIHVHQAVIT